MQKQRDPIARAIAQESDKVNYVKFDRIGKMVSEQEYYDSLSWGQKGHFTRHKRAMQREELQKNRELSHSVVATNVISKINTPSSAVPSLRTLAALKAHATRRKNKELLEQSVDNSVLVVDKNNVPVDINNVSPKALAAYKAHATKRWIKGGRKYKIVDDKPIPFIKNTLSSGGKKIFLEVTPISPRTLAAYKAHDTRRKNKELKVVSDNEIPSVKLWNGPGKEFFRNQVISRLNEYGCGYVLALESEQLLFVNALPNHNFVIFEHDPKIFDAIKKRKPSNIRSLVNADIGTAKNDFPYRHAFLDFCNTYAKNVVRLKLLAKVLKNSKIIALTFSVRGHKSWNHGDYQTDIGVRLRSIFKNHEVVYGTGYKDGKYGANMFGIILQHKDVNV
jgi:hypothetical protein